MLTPGRRRARLPSRQVLAVASAVAASAAVTVALALTGPGSVAAPAAAAAAARTAVAFALPGLLLAALATSSAAGRRAVPVAAAGGGVLVAGGAVWRWDGGGWAFVPAALLLLLAAAAPPEPPERIARRPVRNPARGDLVVAGAAATVGGIAGRAVTLDGVAQGVADVLHQTAVGVVVLGWPLVAVALLPERRRHRALVAAAAGAVALLLARGPAGGEGWLVPGVALALSAALVRPAPPRRAADRVDAGLVALAALVTALVTAALAVAGSLGRDVPPAGWVALAAGAAVVPVGCAACLVRHPASRNWHRVTSGAVAAGVVIAALGLGDRPGVAPFAAVPMLVAVACRPALPSWPVALAPSRRRRALVGAVLAAGFVAGVVVVPQLGGGPGSVALASGALGDARAGIAAADARFLADVAGTGDLVPGARCYFLAGPGGVYDDAAVCGPVLHGTDDSDGAGTDDGSPAGAWDVYPVRARLGTLVHAGEPTRAQQVETAMLHRPDGLRPPDVDAQRQAHVADPGFATSDIDDPDDATPADGFVLAGTTEVGVTQLARPDTVGDGEGAEVRAPDGFRFVAAELTFDRADGDRVEGITLEVVDGRHRIDVTDAVTGEGESESDDGYRDGWVAALEVDDGLAPTLAVSYRGRTQELSLGDGERRGSDPLLYDPLVTAVDRATPGSPVVVTVPGPAPRQVELDTPGHRVESASLGTFDPNRGWAPRGQAWLALTVTGLGEPQPTGPDAVPPDGSLRFDPYGSFTLRLPDGTALPPAAAYPADGGELAVVFAVDDSTRSASFRAAPRWLLTVGDQAVGVASTPVDVAVELG